MSQRWVWKYSGWSLIWKGSVGESGMEPTREQESAVVWRERAKEGTPEGRSAEEEARRREGRAR